MSNHQWSDEADFQLAAGSTATAEPWVLLKRLKECKQSAVAEAIGIDAGQFSHVLAGKAGMPFPKFKALLDELGLKLVDSNACVIDPQDFDALARMAGRMLMQSPHAMLKG